MKIQIQSTVENVERYQSSKDNSIGANIMVSNLENKRREFLTFNSKDPVTISKFENLLQEKVYIILDLQQNNFGLRFGDILHIEKMEK